MGTEGRGSHLQKQNCSFNQNNGRKDHRLFEEVETVLWHLEMVVLWSWRDGRTYQDGSSAGNFLALVQPPQVQDETVIYSGSICQTQIFLTICSSHCL